MSLAVDIIKQGGRRPTESYSSNKLKRSVEAACLAVRTPDKSTDTITDIVRQEVESWLKNKQEVTSYDIRVITIRSLQKHNPEAAYLYEQYTITL
jgi:transcriptional regulator NrdR family protein